MAGGLKEALNLLRGLDLAARERILIQMAKTDPELVEVLRHQFITFEDFKYLTPLMLHELIKTATPERVGTALRLAPREIQNFVLQNVTAGMRTTLQEILQGPPLPVTQVQEAYQKLMDITEQMAKEGKIIIDPSGQEKMV